MSRDNVVYATCGLLLGLIIGSFLVGPRLARTKLAGNNQPAAADAPAPSGPQDASSAGAGPMTAVRKQIDDLKQRIAANPNDADALVQLADMYMQVSKFDQAAEYFERALQVRNDSNVRTDLGICYKQVGKLDKALAAFEQVAREQPAQWQSIYNLAIIYGDLRRFDEARAQLAKLRQMRPGDPDVQRLEQALAAN